MWHHWFFGRVSVCLLLLGPELISEDLKAHTEQKLMGSMDFFFLMLAHVCVHMGDAPVEEHF